MATLPKHVVEVRNVIFRGRVVGPYYVAICSICGRLSNPSTRTAAENRKSTHDRGQDAGADG